MWSYYFSSISSMYVPQGRKPGLDVAQTPVPSCSNRFRHEATLRGPGGKFVSKMTLDPLSEGQSLFCQHNSLLLNSYYFPMKALKKKHLQTGSTGWLFRGKHFSSSSQLSLFWKACESRRLAGDENGDLTVASEMGLNIPKAANASLKKSL